jgi:hypothetical protein
MENDDFFEQFPIDDPSVPNEQVKEWVHDTVQRIDSWASHIHGLVDKERWPQVVSHLELFVRANQKLAGVIVHRFITEDDMKQILKQKAEMEMGVPVEVEVRDIGIMRGFSIIPQDITFPDTLEGWDDGTPPA